MTRWRGKWQKVGLKTTTLLKVVYASVFYVPQQYIALFAFLASPFVLRLRGGDKEPVRDFAICTRKSDVSSTTRKKKTVHLL